MRISKKIISVCVLAAAVTFTSRAQQTAMTFIDNAISPRMAAMGGLSAGLEADSYAHFGNVAAIPFSQKTFSVGAAYNGWQPSTARTNAAVLGATYKVGNFGVSLGASSSIYRSYESMDEAGVSRGQFTPIDYRVGAGVSYLAMDCLSVGLTLNYARSIISSYHKDLNTFFADIQVIYRYSDFNFSLSGNNLGLPVKSYAGTSYSLPMNAELAASYSNEWGDHSLEAGLGGKMYFAGKIAGGVSVGAEYSFKSLVSARVGYHYGSKKVGLPSFASVGLGGQFAGVRIDAAYLITASDSPFRNTFSVGVGWSF